MTLGDAVFVCRIALGALNRADLSLAGDAALDLVADFGARAIFERISATAGHERENDGAEDRPGLHRSILGKMRRFATATLNRCSVEALNRKQLYCGQGFPLQPFNVLTLQQCRDFIRASSPRL